MRLKKRTTDRIGGISLQKNVPVGSMDPVVQSSDFWDLYRDGITQSTLRHILLCPERARLAMVEGLYNPSSSSALEFGTLVHKVMDTVYSDAGMLQQLGKNLRTEGNAFDIALKGMFVRFEREDRDRLNETGDVSALAGMEMEYGLAEIIMPEYFRRWEEDIGSYEWVSLEETFDVIYRIPQDLVDKLALPASILRVRGKFDGIVRINGKLWLFESKTKGQFNEVHVIDTMPYELQVGLYMWAAKKVYGEQLQGVVYNIIRRPQLRQGARESLVDFLERVRADVSTRRDFYFLRLNCAIDSDDQREFQKTLHGVLRTTILWERGLYHYKNSGACTLPGRVCPYLGMCAREDMAYLRKRENLFSELAVQDSEVGSE